MDVQELLIDFFRPVAMGTGAVLAVILLVGWHLPKRGHVDARPPREN